MTDGLPTSPISRPLDGVEKPIYTNQQKKEQQSQSKKKKKAKPKHTETPEDEVILSHESEPSDVKTPKKSPPSEIGKGNHIDIVI